MAPRTSDRSRSCTTALVVVLALFAGAILVAPRPLGAQDAASRGKVVYDRWCAGCHGYEGRGDGYAAEYMYPRPRDFTQALYQIRTTGSGQLPTDADIMRVIDQGMPGTTMPGWSEYLSQSDRRAVMEYIKSFSRFFANSPAPEQLTFTRATRATPEAIQEGRRFYTEIECNKCHGEEGRGDGQSAPTIEDDQGDPIRVADLTENWTFNGGGTAEDIYRRLRTGLDGTPMPSFSDLLDAGFMTDDQLWGLAHYVRSLAPERPPAITEVIRAGLVPEGATLPSTVADEAWDGAERFYVPMAGQIIVKPRWFDPRVDGIWVEALHDGQELAIRLTWSDPSRSPDPEWAPWQARIMEGMQPLDDAPPTPGPLPDRMVVQFPTTIPTGMQRPYFLMGDNRNPVYLWQWESTGSGAVEAVARGIGSVAPQPASGQSLASDAGFQGGQWQIVLRRSLVNEDAEDLQFAMAQAIPIAFSAWDGDNGESGNRRAISSWYYVYLEQATRPTVFVAPLVAMILTGLLGFMVVAQAQKRERRAETEESA